MILQRHLTASENTRWRVSRLVREALMKLDQANRCGYFVVGWNSLPTAAPSNPSNKVGTRFLL